MLGRLLPRTTVDTPERSFDPAAYGIDRDPWLTVVDGYRGPLVDRARALRNAAVVACIRTLCNGVAKAPIDVVRDQNGKRIPITPAPPLVAAPSAIVKAKTWRKQVTFSVLTDGNAFGDIVDVDAAMRPTQIEILDPEKVTNREIVKGKPTARVDGAIRHLYPHGDLWHFPGQLVPPGTCFAISPLKSAAESIGASLSAESFGTQFFTGGGHPTAIIYSDQVLDTDQAKAIKSAFRQATTGTREPAVFGSGVKYERIQSSLADAAAIDLLRFEIEQICRHFGMPPTMVYAAMSGQNVTYANVTQADLNYLKHTLDDHFDPLEEAITDLLPRPQFVKFNRDAVLRSDPKSRAEIHEIRLRTKTRAVNEVRRIEDEPPFDDPIYDEPGIPGATTPSADHGGA
jgi:HK97 family phage portal protein